METYFAYSDESGAFFNGMTDKQIKSDPYYVRASLLINSNEWNFIKTEIQDYKYELQVPKEKEIKWNYLYPILKSESTGEVIDPSKDYYFLSHLKFDNILNFIEKSLTLISNLNEKEIIITYTQNVESRKINEKKILKWHIENHLQRIQYEMASRSGLCCFRMDQCEEHDYKGKNKYFKEVYNDFINNGDRFIKFNNLLDSLSIDNSNQSTCIQLVDYIAGICNSYFKSYYSKNSYSYSKELFYKYIRPSIRNSHGRYSGVGFIEIPTDNKVRKSHVERFIKIPVKELRVIS